VVVGELYHGFLPGLRIPTVHCIPFQTG
jgi:hypothetical protein